MCTIASLIRDGTALTGHEQYSLWSYWQNDTARQGGEQEKKSPDPEKQRTISERCGIRWCQAEEWVTWETLGAFVLTLGARCNEKVTAPLYSALTAMSFFFYFLNK